MNNGNRRPEKKAKGYHEVAALRKDKGKRIWDLERMNIEH